MHEELKAYTAIVAGYMSLYPVAGLILGPLAILLARQVRGGYRQRELAGKAVVLGWGGLLLGVTFAGLLSLSGA
jgi:hypothetical protein